MMRAMPRAALLVLFVACTGSATLHVSRPVVDDTQVHDSIGSAPSTADEPAGADASMPAEPNPAAAPAEKPIVFGLLDGDVALEEAWDRWRAGATTTYDAVFEIAVLANRARPLAMADELMVIALARAVELSGCEPERLGKIRLLAIAVRTADHPRELDGELTRLSDVGPAECAQLGS